MGENWGNLGDFEQVGSGLHGIGDDAFGLFDGILSSVMFILDMGPFLILEGFLGIKVLNFFVVELNQGEFSIFLVDGIVSSGDLDAEFFGEFSDSVLGLLDIITELCEFLVTLVLEVEDEIIIFSLFLLHLVFHISE